jgi:hypothetical protein
MKDVFDVLEDRLDQAKIAGELTDEDREAIAESRADYARGDYTLVVEPRDAERSQRSGA